MGNFIMETKEYINVLNTMSSLMILTIILGFILWFILGIYFSNKGGKVFYYTDSSWRIIVGFILINFLGLLISFLAYWKQQKKRKRR